MHRYLCHVRRLQLLNERHRAYGDSAGANGEIVQDLREKTDASAVKFIVTLLPVELWL